MSDLLDLYEKSTADNVVKAREQSEGEREVNHFDLQNDFSDNFTARTPGDKSIQLSSDPTDTNGNFTEDARNYYDTELADLTDRRYQKYNRQNKYLEGNNAPGAIYQNSSGVNES